MTFNDFVKSALSNDIVCVVDDILNGEIIRKPEAAFRLIDNDVLANREIDRFTIIPRIDGSKGKMLAVTIKQYNDLKGDD